MKINITLPDDFLGRVDKTAQREHLSRSEFLRKAVETYWRALEAEEESKRRIRDIKEAIKIQDAVRKKAGKWDAVAEIRKWREAR